MMRWPRGGGTKVRIAAGALAFVAAAIVALHRHGFHLPVPFGAALGGCPLAARPAHAGEVDAVRQRAVEGARAGGAAPCRPALRFVLDETTHDAVMAWSRARGVTCADVRDGLVHCTDVPNEALGLPRDEARVRELSLAFDDNGRLVNGTTLRVRLSDHAAERTLAGISSRMTAALGTAAGSLDASRLSKVGPTSLSQMRYRFRDYMAEAIAMRLPRDGIVVREHFISARDDGPRR
jgi:hypothetical protein